MPVTRFHALLADKIAGAIEKANAELATGAAKDYPQYRDLVGYIRGMQDCLKLCDEIEQSYD